MQTQSDQCVRSHFSITRLAQLPKTSQSHFQRQLISTRPRLQVLPLLNWKTPKQVEIKELVRIAI